MKEDEKEVLLDKKDYDQIKSFAQHDIINKSFPKHVGEERRELTADDARVVVIIEATLSFLKSKNLLEKDVKFDYKTRHK